MSREKFLELRKGVKYTPSMRKRRLPADVKAYFVRMGRIGGQLGGKARAERLDPERRKEIARKAVQARWAKRSESKG